MMRRNYLTISVLLALSIGLFVCPPTAEAIRFDNQSERDVVMEVEYTTKDDRIKRWKTKLKAETDKLHTFHNLGSPFLTVRMKDDAIGLLLELTRVEQSKVVIYDGERLIPLDDE